MVQTWADRREWDGPAYHIAGSRRALGWCLKVYGNWLHPVGDERAAQGIACAARIILALNPDVVGLGGKGLTSAALVEELEKARSKHGLARLFGGAAAGQFTGQIEYWGSDSGLDAAAFLEQHGVEPPY